MDLAELRGGGGGVALGLGKLAASPRYKGGIQLARAEEGGGEASTESSSVCG